MLMHRSILLRSILLVFSLESFESDLKDLEFDLMTRHESYVVDDNSINSVLR